MPSKSGVSLRGGNRSSSPSSSPSQRKADPWEQYNAGTWPRHTTSAADAAATIQRYWECYTYVFAETPHASIQQLLRLTGKDSSTADLPTSKRQQQAVLATSKIRARLLGDLTLTAEWVLGDTWQQTLQAYPLYTYFETLVEASEPSFNMIIPQETDLEPWKHAVDVQQQRCSELIQQIETLALEPFGTLAQPPHSPATQVHVYHQRGGLQARDLNVGCLAGRCLCEDPESPIPQNAAQDFLEHYYTTLLNDTQSIGLPQRCQQAATNACKKIASTATTLNPETMGTRAHDYAQVLNGHPQITASPIPCQGMYPHLADLLASPTEAVWIFDQVPAVFRRGVGLLSALLGMLRCCGLTGLTHPEAQHLLTRFHAKLIGGHEPLHLLQQQSNIKPENIVLHATHNWPNWHRAGPGLGFKAQGIE